MRYPSNIKDDTRKYMTGGSITVDIGIGSRNSYVQKLHYTDDYTLLSKYVTFNCSKNHEIHYFETICVESLISDTYTDKFMTWIMTF